ncbi:hypothetical protein JCM10207_000027 [Rhodosporidiobolus poonsookiae]
MVRGSISIAFEDDSGKRYEYRFLLVGGFAFKALIDFVYSQDLDDMERFYAGAKNDLGWVHRLKLVYEADPAKATLQGHAVTVFPPAASPTIDLKLGTHPHYRILSFPLDSPPSLAELLAQASALNLGLHQSVFLIEPEGTTVRLDSQERWLDVGWPRSKKVFGEGKRAGDWQAAAFHVGKLPSTLLLPPSSSEGSTAPLFSPAPSDVDLLTSKLSGARLGCE